ncbi:MAG: chemotaxis protein CheW [Polyangiaceae bacterium]
MLSKPTSTEGIAHLVVGLGPWRCALRASDVQEVMRELPVWSIGELPRGVRGFARVRGGTVPVIDLARILGVNALANYWVTTKERPVACAVETVLGVQEFPRGFERPALLGDCAPALTSIAEHDGRLYGFLASARLLDEVTYRRLLTAAEESA